jgi:hypothetical protein
MPENCKNCGLELFVGQRFCRSCGAPTDPLAGEQAPTQMMTPQSQDWAAQSGAKTAPASRPETSPVYDPSTGYQPTVPPMHPQMIPPYTPPPSRSRLGWILAFVGMGLFVAVVVAVMMIARFGRRLADNVQSTRSATTIVAGPNETALSESTADQVQTAGPETTLTKLFPLGPSTRFSITSMNGSITVGGWDNTSAEVKVIKRGSSDRGSQVFFTNDKAGLSIRTAQSGGNGNVRYEIKLPRDSMSRIELRSTNGSIKFSDLTSDIVVENSNGSIEMTNVVGVSRAQTAQGKIVAVLQEAPDGPMDFTALNGKIDITLKAGFDATLQASTVRGGIDLDDQFGIAVTKQLVGQQANGQIGLGGPLLKLTTVNGSIKIAKQQ